MNSDAVISGVGMHPFGKHLGLSMKDMARVAVDAALADASIGVPDVQAVFFSNALAGLITGQECIRGEVTLYPLGLAGIPIHNVENACASGGNALHLAWMAVASGMYDTVLAVGVEKTNLEDRQRTFSAYAAGMDVEEGFATGDGAGQERSPFVDRQARLASTLFDERGVTLEGLARVASRSLEAARLNPFAHRRFGASPEDVLNARVVVEPLTSLMSSPISDGAAAVVVTSRPEVARSARAVPVLASRMATRPPKDQPDAPNAVEASTRLAYEQAGLGPEDMDLAEVHDASVAYELMAWTDTGLCAPGDEQRWAMEGVTDATGSMPVNRSGGLVGRGHALGASGLAQVHDVVQQLRGEAGDLQLADPQRALVQIGGGVVDWLTAASSVHILGKG
ncbi:thiolase family protein [Microbacterium sp. SLBN-146]|uniref:thiolase family protein n=1 Tax=Microbacterium sp. SLBN-146 TaxID=2768457 RepID=UPI00115235B6|nr:thiolase family protein [Microbacterium sp. SLBN-146]TQJ29952.1 acetyl-CoA acetyltransferase [Microbacterium sp. SLBN-146]